MVTLSDIWISLGWIIVLVNSFRIRDKAPTLVGRGKHLVHELRERPSARGVKKLCLSDCSFRGEAVFILVIHPMQDLRNARLDERSMRGDDQPCLGSHDHRRTAAIKRDNWHARPHRFMKNQPPGFGFGWE
jgi:hypothetical protein